MSRSSTPGSPAGRPADRQVTVRARSTTPRTRTRWPLDPALVDVARPRRGRRVPGTPADSAAGRHRPSPAAGRPARTPTSTPRSWTSSAARGPAPPRAVTAGPSTREQPAIPHAASTSPGTSPTRLPSSSHHGRPTTSPAAAAGRRATTRRRPPGQRVPGAAPGRRPAADAASAGRARPSTGGRSAGDHRPRPPAAPTPRRAADPQRRRRPDRRLQRHAADGRRPAGRPPRRSSRP